MKGKTLSLAFAALFLGIAVSLAGLDATPILNHSFEDVSDPGNPWGYEIDEWFEEELDGFATFWEDGLAIGLVGDEALWAGTEAGGAYYQTIGTVDDDLTYRVTALIGSRWGTSFGTGHFSLYASSTDAATNAADTVALSSFATLITNATVTTAVGVPTGDENVYAVTVLLPTGTGHAGEVLWLELGSVSGKDYFDNIAIELYTGALPPAPEWTAPTNTLAEGVQGVAYSGQTLAGLAVDSNGDAITYGKGAGGPTWLTVAPDGELGGTPDTLGTNTFTVTATDGTGTNSATLLIPIRTSLPPTWNSTPVTGSGALVDIPYSDTLAGEATDPDGAPITYSLVDTGTWLSVTNNGAMTGTPASGDVGINTFTVVADDGIDSPATNTLEIVVVVPVLTGDFGISINFSNGGANEVLDSATAAGLAGFVMTNWNTTAGPADTLNDLVDTAGDVTAASANWTSANTWGDGTADGDATLGIGDAQVARGYLDDNPACTVDVTGIPYAEYAVVIYISTDNAEQFGSYTVNGTGTGGTTAGTAHLYQVPTWDSSNTFVIPGLSGDLSIVGPGKAHPTRGSIAGIQIIDTSSQAVPAENLIITGPVSSGTEMVLAWTGVAGLNYTVQTNSNLIIANWGNVDTGIPGINGTVTYTNVIGSTEDEVFYRVVTEE